MTTQQNATRVRLENVRITFPRLFAGEAEQFEGKGDAYYSGNFLLSKDHPGLKALSDAIMAAAQKKWKDKAAEKVRNAKARDKLPVHSGELKADKPYGAAYAGMLYVSARNNASKNPPIPVYDNVIDPKTNAAKELSAADARIYSGCYVNVLLDIFGYDQGGEGLGAAMAGVQFHADGERLSGVAPARADDFVAHKAADAVMPDNTGSADSLFN